MQTAFTLGLQYPPLAKEAFAALERWETEQAQAFRAVAPQIVPLLDPYLLEITDLAADSDATADARGRHPTYCCFLCRSVFVQFFAKRVFNVERSATVC